MDITMVLMEIRRRLGLSRPELSRMMGFADNYIWLLEHKYRKPSIETCLKIMAVSRDKACFKVEFGMLRDDLK